MEMIQQTKTVSVNILLTANESEKHTRTAVNWATVLTLIFILLMFFFVQALKNCTVKKVIQT